MKKLLIALSFLNLVILIMTLIEFIALDRKLDWIINKQSEVNSEVYKELRSHEQSVRLLATDTDILMNIVTSKEYCEVKDE